jgi:ATP-dependent DNA helicase RecG
MYGDLNMSRITEMPKNRQLVDTFVVNDGYRARVNDFIKKQVALGGQCYIVCPAIEAQELDEDAVVYDSETASMLSYGALKLKNATEYYEEIKRALPEIRIGLLHGKMKPAEKDDVMNRFASGEFSVIVSTTVIEVGINVPNATLIVIENAERFGLSQLHQLRGRVGRGAKKSYCILVSDLNTDKAKDRLDIIRTTHNGFEISEKDLLMRGPGDFVSSNNANNLRQSGGFDFRFVQLCENADLMTSTFTAAKSVIESDPELALSEHALIKKESERFIVKTTSTIS